MGRERRKSRGKKINPTLFVFCEGKTEESYINLLKSEYRIPSIIIHPKIRGNDITDKFINNYKKDKPSHPKDQTFLFYDLDVPGMIIRLQKIKNCTLLLSNPCVELWFLLHYKNQTAHTNSEYCCKELKKRNKYYKKGSIDIRLKEKLITKRKEAIKKAKKLQSHENPSTTIYQLIEKLDALKK